MNDQMKYGLLGLCIGALAMWIIIPIINPSANTVGNNQRLRSSDMLDAHFIEQMIPHHEDAVTMAKLAQTKAKTPEVKQLAQNIITSQSQEIDQMKVWYKEWYGKEVPKDNLIMGGHGMGQNSRMHMGMMGDDTDITELEQAENFDKTFVELMIPHHQMAVMMATMLKSGTQRLEMSKLAGDIMNTQTNEINQMRQWLAGWSK